MSLHTTTKIYEIYEDAKLHKTYLEGSPLEIILIERD